MKRTIVCAAAFLFIAASVHAQAWRGMGRIQGTVTELGSSKPVEGALVQLQSVKAGNEGPEIKTDRKGKWAALGLGGGTWNIDVTAEGYIPRQIAVQLSEVTR
ncbi:MAG: carboxypeptidase-like regulatory domain-containing protein, partial [Acidobacteria bacterium]|nr:carboxypeptidase-like regulatory domain-containing protein [Acidobacteriota bacterium]